MKEAVHRKRRLLFLFYFASIGLILGLFYVSFIWMAGDPIYLLLWLFALGALYWIFPFLMSEWRNLMKLVTWNVNGLRACMNKGFKESMEKLDADIISIQETKMQREQASFDFPGYYEYWNSAVKKGYSERPSFPDQAPFRDLWSGHREHDHSQRELARLSYRMAWEDAFQAYCEDLSKKKTTIVCGDMNVAHEPIDLKNPDSNHHNAGFSDEERQKLDAFLARGFVDSFRMLYPDREGAYTWWSYMFKARERNAGWRIDYFLVSEAGRDKIRDVTIMNEIMGSDHCPVVLEYGV